MICRQYHRSCGIAHPMHILLVLVVLLVTTPVMCAITCNTYVSVQEVTVGDTVVGGGLSETNTPLACPDATNSTCFTYQGELNGLDYAAGGCLLVGTACDSLAGEVVNFSCNTCEEDSCNEVITFDSPPGTTSGGVAGLKTILAAVAGGGIMFLAA